jgi:hypothetical protein
MVLESSEHILQLLLGTLWFHNHVLKMSALKNILYILQTAISQVTAEDKRRFTCVG